jgi:hypothetical protein
MIHIFRFQEEPDVNDGKFSRRQALRVGLMAAAAAGTLGLAACGGGTETDVSTLRFANASPDTLNFRIDGASAFVGLNPYGAVSTYNDLTTGPASFASRASSGTVDLATATTTLVKDRFYTVLAYGTIGQPRLRVIEEINDRPTAGIRVRIFNAVPGSVGLNVYFTPASASTLPPTPTFTVGAYDAALGDFGELAELNHRIRITAAGSTAVLYDSGTSAVGFGSRAVVTLVALPSNSGSNLNLSALPERSSSGRGAIDNALF